MKRLMLRLADQFALPASRSSSPIFVVGCSHSGTSLLLRCLAQHPDLHGIDHETWAFANPTTTRSAKAFDARHSGHGRWVEKTPDHVFHLGRIWRYFPGATVVVIERDGRDVAASLAERPQYTVALAASKWVRAIEAGRARD